MATISKELKARLKKIIPKGELEDLKKLERADKPDELSSLAAKYKKVASMLKTENINVLAANPNKEKNIVDQLVMLRNEMSKRFWKKHQTLIDEHKRKTDKLNVEFSEQLDKQAKQVEKFKEHMEKFVKQFDTTTNKIAQDLKEIQQRVDILNQDITRINKELIEQKQVVLDSVSKVQRKFDDGVGQIFTEDFFKKNPNVPRPGFHKFKEKIKEKLEALEVGGEKLLEKPEELLQHGLKNTMKECRGILASVLGNKEVMMKEKIKQLDELEVRLLTDKGLMSDFMGAMTKYINLIEKREGLKKEVGNLQAQMKKVASGDLNEVMKVVLPKHEKEDEDRHQLETPFDMVLKRK